MMMTSACEKISAPQTNDDKMNQNRQNNLLTFTDHSLPPLPSCKLTDAHDDVTLPTLIQALKDRHKIRQIMISEHDSTAKSIQSALQEVDNKLIAKDGIIHEQNNQLMEKDEIIQNNLAEIARLEKRSKMQELEIHMLQETTRTWEAEKCALQKELEALDHRLQKELSEKRSMQQHMHNVIRNIEDKCEKERDRCIKGKMEVQDKLWIKEEKLRQLKDIMTECQWSRPETLPPRPQPSRPAKEEQLLPFFDSLQASQEPNRFWTEDAEGNPRTTCYVPSDSKYISAVKCLSEWERRAKMNRSQENHATSLPIRCPSPSGSRVCRGSVCVRPEDVSYPAFDMEVMAQSHQGDVTRSRGPGRTIQFNDEETLDQQHIPRKRNKSSGRKSPYEH